MKTLNQRANGLIPPDAKNGSGWEELRKAIARQPQVSPPPEVRRRVLARVRVREAEKLALPPSWLTWAWGVALALLTTALLWGFLQPGIVLQWATGAESPAAFRIYRAPLGNDEIVLIHELPVEQPAQSYTYVDMFTWPGQIYVYQVAAVGAQGETLGSQQITVNALEALPGQLAVLLSGVIVGYAAIIFVQRREWLLAGG
ncbi:MAG: hypothetical protein J7M17_07015 [Anaerolineae bacterium]|nr:hypothetical protein [Anaerolineae bacterium]